MRAAAPPLLRICILLSCAAAARAQYNECEEACDRCERDACDAAGQDCIDVNTDPDALGTWVCRCRPPNFGKDMLAEPAACKRDECLEYNVTCAVVTPPQACYDGNTSAASLDDWECHCIPPADGTRRLAAAVCTLNECDSECATCANTTCVESNQQCRDPSPTPEATRDWECECPAPLIGSATATAASCSLDECKAPPPNSTCKTCAAGVCEAAGQACMDPNTSPDRVRDWKCTCVAPEMGDAGVMEPADCILDECIATCDTCEMNACGSAQTCNDPDQSTTATGDWVCICTPPLSGVGRTSLAFCILDECSVDCSTCEGGEVCANATGPGGPQECFDTNTSTAATSDWVCRCQPPSQTMAVGAAAECTLDECCEDCKGGQACAGAGQTCVDKHQGLDEVMDFNCICTPPLVGYGTGAAAVCGDASTEPPPAGANTTDAGSDATPLPPPTMVATLSPSFIGALTNAPGGARPGGGGGNAGSDASDDENSSGALIGAIVGGFIGAMVLVGCIYYARQRAVQEQQRTTLGELRDVSDDDDGLLNASIMDALPVDTNVTDEPALPFPALEPPPPVPAVFGMPPATMEKPAVDKDRGPSGGDEETHLAALTIIRTSLEQVERTLRQGADNSGKDKDTPADAASVPQFPKSPLSTITYGDIAELRKDLRAAEAELTPKQTSPGAAPAASPTPFGDVRMHTLRRKPHPGALPAASSADDSAAALPLPFDLENKEPRTPAYALSPIGKSSARGFSTSVKGIDPTAVRSPRMRLPKSGGGNVAGAYAGKHGATAKGVDI